MNRGDVCTLAVSDCEINPVCGIHFFKEYLDEPAFKNRYDLAVGHLKYLLIDVNDLKSRYIKLGFHLDEFNRCRYYSTLGFNDIYGFAEANLGLDRSAVSRCIAVYKEFSSPKARMTLDEKYRDYSYSQLCEMVSISGRDRKKIKPEMTIRQIRELKKQGSVRTSGVDAIKSLKETLDKSQKVKTSVVESAEPVIVNDDIPGQTSIEQDFPEYLPEEQEKSVATSQLKEKKLFEYVKYCNLSGDKRAVYIKSRDLLEDKHRFVVIHFFDCNGHPVFFNVSGVWLNVIYYEKESNAYYVRLNQSKEVLEGISVGYIEPSKKPQEAPPVPIRTQPELPILKNDSQRREWLENYKAWGLWYYDEHIDVNYYKYDFSDGSRLIVTECLGREEYWPTGRFDAHDYYLLQRGVKNADGKKYDRKFRPLNCSSMTDLLTYLKGLKVGKKSSTK